MNSRDVGQQRPRKIEPIGFRKLCCVSYRKLAKNASTGDVAQIPPSSDPLPGSRGLGE